MKTVITCLLLFVLCTSTQAQLPIPQGSYLLGGSAAFQAQKADDTRVNALQVNPKLGYAIIPNLILTITGLASRTTFNNSLIDEKYTFNNLGIGPGLRYYVPVSEQFAVLGEVGSLFSRGSTKRPDNSREGYNSGYFFGGLGAAFFLTSSVSVEGVISYRRSKDSFDGNVFSNSEMDSNSLQMNFGFQIVLPSGNNEN